jgi:hypothetical protein
MTSVIARSALCDEAIRNDVIGTILEGIRIKWLSPEIREICRWRRRLTERLSDSSEPILGPRLEVRVSEMLAV